MFRVIISKFLLLLIDKLQPVKLMLMDNQGEILVIIIPEILGEQLQVGQLQEVRLQMVLMKHQQEAFLVETFLKKDTIKGNKEGHMELKREKLKGLSIKNYILITMEE